jgi:uncharacterized membrane protein YhhN
VLLGLTAVHCVGQALDVRALRVATKPLLGLALAGVAAAASPAGRRPSRRLLGALAFSTAGDVALLGESQPAFLAGMGAFLGAQGCYVGELTRLGALMSLRRSPFPAVAYSGLWAAANGLLGSRLGSSRVPVAVYSAALVTMAASASRLGRRGAWGGGLFALSDGLIGLRTAGVRWRGQDVTVMATYVAAQYLLVTAAVEADGGCAEVSDGRDAGTLLG